MPANTNTLTLTIAVDDKGSMVVKSFAGGVDAAGKQVKSSADGMTMSFGNLTGMLEKAAAALAIWKAADFVKDSTMAAARFETLGVVLERLSKNSSYTTIEIKSFEQGLRNAGIAGIEARTILAQMIQSNLDLGKATDLARVAQDAAVLASLNSSETLERMMHAIQSNSVEIIRTIGLSVSFEDATKRMAAQLGKTVEQMTEGEKMQARLNAVLQAGVTIQGAYESAMNTAGKQINSFRRYVLDFEIAFGKAFNPALTAIVFGASEAIKELTKTVEDPAFQSSLTSAGNAIGEGIVTGMQYLIANKDAIRATFAGIAEGVALGFKGLVALNKGIDDLRDKAYGIQRGTYGDKLRSDIAEKERDLASYEKSIWPQQKYIDQMKQEIQLMKDKLVLYEAEAERKRQLRELNSKGGWDYLASGRSAYNGPIGPPPGPDPLSKEAQAALKKFTEDYQKTIDGEYAYEVQKLDDQLKEYAKHVQDKAKLDEWYRAKKREIDIKEYAAGGADMTQGDYRKQFRTLGEILANTQDKGSYTGGWENDGNGGLTYVGSNGLNTGGWIDETKRTGVKSWAQNQASKDAYEAQLGKEREAIRLQDELANSERWWKTYIEDIEEAARANEIFKSSMDIMSQSFSDAAARIITQSGSLSSNLQSMANSIIASMIRMTTQQGSEALFGMLFKTGVSLASTYFGSDTPTGMGTNSTFNAVSTGNTMGSYLALVKHSGGAIGSSGPYRSVPAWMIPSAPRLHSGLSPDERVVVMQVGEEVRSRKQVAEDRQEKSNPDQRRAQPQIIQQFIIQAPQGRVDRDSVAQTGAAAFSAARRAFARNS